MKRNLKDLKNLPPKENIIFNNSKGEMLTDLTIKIKNGEMLVFEKGTTTPVFILNNYKNINFHVDEKTMSNIKEDKNLENEIKENFVLKDDSHFTYIDGANEANVLNKSNVNAVNVLAEEVSTTSNLAQVTSLTSSFGVNPFWILGGLGLAAAGFGVSKMSKKAKDDDAKYKIDNNFNNEVETETTPINKENKKPEETKPNQPMETKENSSTSPEENNSRPETPTPPSQPEDENTNIEEPNLSENTESNSEENSTETQPPIVEPVRKIEIISIGNNSKLSGYNGDGDIIVKFKTENFKEGDIVNFYLENNSTQNSREKQNPFPLVVESNSINGEHSSAIVETKIHCVTDFFVVNHETGEVKPGDCVETYRDYFGHGDFKVFANVATGDKELKIESESIYLSTYERPSRMREDRIEDNKPIEIDLTKPPPKMLDKKFAHYVIGTEKNNNFLMEDALEIEGNGGSDKFIFGIGKSRNNYGKEKTDGEIKSSQETWIKDFGSDDKILIKESFLKFHNIENFDSRNLLLKDNEFTKVDKTLVYNKGGEEFKVAYVNFADGFTMSNDYLSNYVSII